MKSSDVFFHHWEIIQGRLVIFLKENVLFKPNEAGMSA